MAVEPDMRFFLETLRAAKRVVVITGAGISAESGIPTFRDALTGLWSRYRAEELATPEAFARNPKLVWDWYNWRRERVRAAQANLGHLALVELERRVPDFTLITQNVDGLHRRAGSQAPLELHGDLLSVRCSSCPAVYRTWDELADGPPPCPACAAPLRPAVVWFGEALPAEIWTRSVAAAARAQVFFSIGTSSLVYPAADLVQHARRNGAFTVEINPDATPQSQAMSLNLRGPAGQILPNLLRELELVSGQEAEHA